ncbi:PREDICTED: protein LONGIFOLIA 1-like [Tarenaya hassleriana]|uniref:protein LONGIFOLIA 1-like n=1 Tax=Tarenaya hassleriana TaxID=28532 RepID=UPI00053C1A29|nr:PREDICTED: protein LONGIFOLIA 1-like [Tarenaya hassleriana]
MSARILYALSDENPAIRNKTEGCRQLHSVQNASFGHHTKLTPGQRQASTSGRQISRAMHEVTEKPTSKAANKSQRAPSLSSRSSVSSSRSLSSFSSADTYHRTSQLDPPFSGNGTFHESRHWSRNSNGLRDVVKDAIHREARRVKTRSTSEDGKGPSTLNCIDSPRPLAQSKFTKNRVYSYDGSYWTIPLKDRSRFSSDKSEMRPTSIMRLQEQPRHCGRQNHRLEYEHKQGRRISCFLNWQREPESRGRTSGVVARLMGIEMLPEPDSMQRFSRTHQNKQYRLTSSLKHTNSEAAKPGVNTSDHKKASSSTPKSTSNALLKLPKRHSSSEKFKQKQTEDDSASSPSLRRGSSSQPLHNLKKNSSLRPIEKARALGGHHSPISESAERPRNHSLQQKKKKQGMDQKHRQAIPSTDSSKTARHYSKGPKKSGGSAIQNLRARIPIPKQPKSGTNQIDHFTNAVVTPKYEFEKARDTSEQYTPKQENSSPGVGEETARPDPLDLVQEQPSPVSILDVVFYDDEPLSPLKKITNASDDEEHLNSKETSWNREDQSDFCHSRAPSLSSENGPNILLANSTPEEIFVQETTVLYGSKHKEHKYISDILSKSGILEDPESSLKNPQIQPSRLPLDPDLFLALEQHEVHMEVPRDGVRYNRSCQTQDSEKMKRKLIFDTVNEILAQMIVSEGLFKGHIQLRILSGERVKGHMILQIVFSEIDCLQAHKSNCTLHDEGYSLKSIFREDLMYREREWTDLQGEIPSIALDVERLIFKDLISEIISGDREANKARPYKHHRRLLSYKRFLP